MDSSIVGLSNREPLLRKKHNWFQTYIKPFSWFAFSSFFLIMGPSFKKNGCSQGLAVVPGPFVLEYSRDMASAFLYTKIRKAKQNKKIKNKYGQDLEHNIT